jgi:hypothetical protein
MDSDFFYAGIKGLTGKTWRRRQRTSKFGSLLGMERGYCMSGVRVSRVVFGVECRVYCCDNRRRFAGCADDWKAIMVGSVKWQR